MYCSTRSIRLVFLVN